MRSEEVNVVQGPKTAYNNVMCGVTWSFAGNSIANVGDLREREREDTANESTGTGILSQDDKKWRMKEAGKESSAMNFLFRISHLPLSPEYQVDNIEEVELRQR